MSTANRLKHRKKAGQQSTELQAQEQAPETQYNGKFKQKQNKASKHSEEQENQYKSYYEISNCNPNGVSYTSRLASSYGIPSGIVCSPVLALENQYAEVMQKNADKLPRCQICRAYMNCYNTIEKNKFKCFLCNRQTELSKDYNPKSQQNLELKSSIYQCLSSPNFYNKQPAEETFVFLIDINPQSSSSRMLAYAIAAIKQVLARPELDETCLYFFTYDELVQFYDFTGHEIKCTINDQTIQGQLTVELQSCFVKDIRDRLFELLDALQQISASNPRKGSNFTKCFQFVFNTLKHTGAKFFILQCNESIAGQQMFKEQLPRLKPQQQTPQRYQKGPSLYETCNKTFFDKYVAVSLQNDCSFSYFTFARNHKNVKAVHDFFKLCSSELKVYVKDSAIQLQRFYYELSYLLGATYFKNVKIECVVNFGWHFTAVYGNFYRVNSYITFQLSSIEPSRKMVILVAPSANKQYNSYIPPFCCIQLITNYQYKRQKYLCVSTIVQPVTGYINKIYDSLDPITIVSAVGKGFFSSLRMDDLNISRKKITEMASRIYIEALSTYKKAQNIPDSILTIMMAILAMLKSIHSQPQVINNTMTMDRVISERIFLQSSGSEISNLFSPYLFNLTDMDPTMCQTEQEFIYPNTVEIKFHNVKDGLYLLDVGLALYLFIAKQCDAGLLQEIFGKSKLTKNDELNEEVLMGQSGRRALQVQNLVRYLREQKSYGWVPLHIVRCGQNTLNQRNFYLFFYDEKYQQFRSYRMNLQQFTAMISKPNSF